MDNFDLKKAKEGLDEVRGAMERGAGVEGFGVFTDPVPELVELMEHSALTSN